MENGVQYMQFRSGGGPGRAARARPGSGPTRLHESYVESYNTSRSMYWNSGKDDCMRCSSRSTSIESVASRKVE